MPKEVWKSIPGFESLYIISSLGRIRKLNGTELTFWEQDGYFGVTLYKNKKYYRKFVHVLVALSFIGSKPVGQETRHKDGNRKNNIYNNLLYGTKRDNQLDSVDHGTHNNARKTHCPKGHKYDEGNTYIYVSGLYTRRACKICRKEAVYNTRNNLRTVS